MLRPLFEAVIPSLKQAIAQSPDNRPDLVDTIADRMTDSYIKASRKAVSELYQDSGREVPVFFLQAKWKQDALRSQARVMALSLSETVGKEEARLAGLDLTDAERKAKLADFLVYKTKQLDSIIQAETQMQAQVDQLVHSGAIDPKRDRVMWLS